MHLKRLPKERRSKADPIPTRNSTAAQRTFGGNSIDIEVDSTIVNRHMARTYVVKDPRSAATDRSSTQSDVETVRRALKNAEIELADARSYIRELVTSIEFDTAERARLESALAALDFDLEDARRGRREDEKRMSCLRLEIGCLRYELRRALRRRHENCRVAGIVNRPLRANIGEQSSGSSTVAAIQEECDF